MAEVFLILLNISITASYMIIAVVLLRLLLKKAPKNYTCILWGLVTLRLALPFNIESIFSLIPSGETISPTVFSNNGSTDEFIDTGFESVNSSIGPSVGVFIDSNKAPLEQLVFILSVIWLVGCFSMLLFGIISYFRLKHKLKFAIRTEDEYYCSEVVKAPFIFGIIRPKIYLPFNLNSSDADFIVKHEKAHISRCDHITKFFAFVLLSVYWFNPLVWLYYFTLQKDIESACDQKVIKNMPTESKQLYSVTLLKYSISPKIHALIPIAFGEISVKQRIKNVMNYKKPTLWIIIVFVLIVVISILGFMTTPIKNDGAEATNPYVSVDAPKDDILTDNNYDSKYYALISAIENGTYNQSLSEFETLLGGNTGIVKPAEDDKSKSPNASNEGLSDPNYTEGTPVSAEAIDPQIKTKCIVIDDSNWQKYYEIVYLKFNQTDENGKKTTITFPHCVKLKDDYTLAPDYDDRKNTVKMRYRYKVNFYNCSFDKNGNVTTLHEKLNSYEHATYNTLYLNDYSVNLDYSNQVYSSDDGKGSTVVLSDFFISYVAGELYIFDK